MTRPDPSVAGVDPIPAVSGKPTRYAAIDAMRGIVMILMALDHSRDFLGPSGIDPRTLTEPLLFLTRWLTHFCAPVFAFLLGASAWFSLQRRGSRQASRRHLVQRGLWLIFLEVSVVRLSWTFDPGAHFILLQILWALGMGMIFLALLLGLPTAVIGGIGVSMIVFHNLLDPVQAASFGNLSWIWQLLHEPHIDTINAATRVWILYPLIPWIGVVAFGYSFAANLVPHARRRRFFLAWGGAMIGLFILLRWTGLYGDPQPWIPQPTPLASLLAFVNCEKYPPSLQFLLMTLGPALALYPLLARIRGAGLAILLTFGQAPLLFYLLHIPLIHFLAVMLSLLRQQSPQWLFGDFPLLHKPAEYGLPLVSVYLLTLIVLLTLFPICRWYGADRRQQRRWWHAWL